MSKKGTILEVNVFPLQVCAGQPEVFWIRNPVDRGAHTWQASVSKHLMNNYKRTSTSKCIIETRWLYQENPFPDLTHINTRTRIQMRQSNAMAISTKHCHASMHLWLFSKNTNQTRGPPQIGPWWPVLLSSASSGVISLKPVQTIFCFIII